MMKLVLETFFFRIGLEIVLPASWRRRSRGEKTSSFAKKGGHVVSSILGHTS